MNKKILLIPLLFLAFFVNATPIDEANKELKKKNYQRAEQLFLDLATAGNSEAQFLLGRMYVDKLLGKEKQKEGIRWLEIAVKNRHQMATEMLGMMYMSGNIVEFSPKRGSEYFMLAGEFRDPFELAPECD